MKELIRFINECPAHVHLPSRQTNGRSVFKLFQKNKHALSNVIRKKSTFYTITCDGWTSLSTNGYISLTIHFMDEQFEFHSNVLSVNEVNGKHTGEAISNVVRASLSSWGLEHDKCVAMVADNAANMKKSAEMLGFLHIGCFAHSIQLVAKSLFRHTLNNGIPKFIESAGC